MTKPNEDHFASRTFQDGELALEFVRFAPHLVHKVPTYYFRMVQADSREELGGIDLRVGFNSHIQLYAGHVGYAVQPAHRGHKYAARSIRLLLSVARELRLDPLWITCDPENMGSRRSCELAGAKFIQTVDVPVTCVIHRSGHKQKCRYRLDLYPVD
jgi:tagatose 1,6-diphosphate aldolase